MAAGLVLLVLVAVCLLPALLALITVHPEAGMLMAFPAALAVGKKDGDDDNEPLDRGEFQKRVLNGVSELRKQNETLTQRNTELTGEIDGLKKVANEQSSHITELRKARLAPAGARGQRRRGMVSDECARAMASLFILHCERSGKMEALASSISERDALLDTARKTFGIQVRDALSTTEIPLPTEYGSEIRELISEFGIVRGRMFPYPIGRGTARPPRMGTRPAFTSVAMSGGMGEKQPTITFASLESHKLGGIVRLPREIDEQSIVPMGQFLARYGAVEFARAEDTWGLLADGTATYESVKGVATIAAEQGASVTLAAGKTKPSDATLEDFRALRREVNKAALNGRLSAYYLDTTWETRLPSFKTNAEPNVYQRLPDGSAILDGYPIVWTDVLEPYGTAAAASKTLALFGALNFWWFGEHGSPRIDTSEHVYFANDQLAVRFIEEIDFDYQAADAMAGLFTPAA